ncbi:MAG: metallophosphoesterase [Ginsengibacter sp.]
MKKFVLVSVALFFSYTICLAQDSLQATIVLIGDAGQLIKGHTPVLSAVKNTIPFNEKTTIIFLGDNLYPTGLPDNTAANYAARKAGLDSQIIIAKGTRAKVYMIPGNHDWQNGGRGGYESIVREQTYVDNYGEKTIKFYPEDGCPGPVEIHITPDIVLLMIDSQWWLHPYDKPGIESDCPYKSKEEVLAQIGDILAKNSKKLVLLTFHHTLKSYGIHGGYFTWKQYIFPFTDVVKNAYIPLPLIGTIYPVTRSVFGTSEDLKHPFYAQFIHDMNEAVKGHQNIVFASGHEHSLQLIKDTGYYYIVSGAGSKATRVSPNKNKLFGSDKHGFTTLEISKNKNVRTTFYTVDSSKVTKAYSENILNFSTLPTPDNPQDTQRQVEYAFKDSVVISASDKYKNSSGFKEIVLGKNYRQEWSTPVKLKEFNISKEKGGFKILSLGGGRQTKSLRLQDKSGKEWVLRSVDKMPEIAIPENLRNTIAQDIARDMVSSDYPYAAAVAGELAKANGIVTSKSELFYVPDDPALGFYQSSFRNSVCVLEERDPTPDNSDTKSSAKVMSKIFEDNDHTVDQQDVLKSRLLDNLIGDWNRHPDQWRWGVRDTGKGRTYYPIPRDRDQAFFSSDGLLLNYFSRNRFPYLHGFKKNMGSVKWLNYYSRNFDRFFLNQLDESQWRTTVDSFVINTTDAVIANSVKKMPPEIYSFSAQKIGDKLISRRDILRKEALKYYSFLSKNVDVVGSNEVEYFRVKQAGEGVQVIVHGQTKASDSGFVMYNRVFNKRQTGEIRLYGLNGNDRFDVDDDVTSKIRLRIIGGKGNDTFNIKGNIKNSIYDLPGEKNVVQQSNRSNIHFSDDPVVNNYRTNGFNYNTHSFPLLNVGYNVDDNFLIGIGISAKTFGFRNGPLFGTSQKLSALYALSGKAYQAKYEGIFNSVLRKNDIIVNAEIVDPTLNYFFGIGNNTAKLSTKKIDFYRVRYKYVTGDLLLRKRLNDVVNVSIGPSYFHYWSNYEDNKKRILGNAAAAGFDSANIYSIKDYLGGRLKFDINFINDEFFPTRGVVWNSEFSSLVSLNKSSHTITKLVSDMQVYAPLRDPDKVVAVVRIGGGHIFSKNFEYFQALNLGANNFLRGFRKNRFSGSSLLYGSFELRIKLFKSQSYILPGNVGLITFYDLGKVWLKGEVSKRVHAAYGGGLYYAPFNLFFISATIGISPEDQLFNFSLGKKFTLTF